MSNDNCWSLEGGLRVTEVKRYDFFNVHAFLFKFKNQCERHHPHTQHMHSQALPCLTLRGLSQPHSLPHVPGGCRSGRVQESRLRVALLGVALTCKKLGSSPQEELP